MNMNYGKANVEVKLLANLPNAQKNKTRHNFDISSHSWPIIQNSPYFSPLLAENVIDEARQFSVCYPSKRRYYIDNYIQTKDQTFESTGDPSILWTATSSLEGVSNDIATTFNEYTLEQPDNYSPSNNGPTWTQTFEYRQAPPDDETVIRRWFQYIKGIVPAGAIKDEKEKEEEEQELQVEKIVYVEQTKVQDGLWWQVESESFLNENMPFWVTIKRLQSPPSATHETSIVISLGIEEKSPSRNGNQQGDDSGKQSFDLYLSNNKKPRLIDYYNGRGGTPDQGGGTTPDTTRDGAPTIEKEFDLDLSTILDYEGVIEVGFMTIGGRLVIFVNGIPMTYTRIVKSEEKDESGTIAEAKIAKGKIRVFGTNIRAAINASPMTFASRAILALPVPTVPPTIDPSTGGSSPAPKYYNIERDGSVGKKSVCVLPKDEADSGGNYMYGVDCRTFWDDNGTSASPNGGLGMHQDGYIWFRKASRVGITSLSSSDFYVLVMKPDDASISPGGRGPYIIPNAQTPYFARLKGGAATNQLPGDQDETDVSNDVISASESSQAEDYFSISTSGNIVLYNKGGTYDYLKERQVGVQVKWGWGGAEGGTLVKTFTGIVVSADTSETPGKETITLDCQDYMYILKNTPIINSPFYDGMLMYYAIKDIVQRGGIQTVINEWNGTEEYFLPSGFTFSKPKLRYPSEQMLYDCAIDVAKRGEATVYFDPNGICRVKKLPGGLFSVLGSDTTPVVQFTRNPNPEAEKGTTKAVLLDEKQVQNSLKDTANKISIFTLDRDTRNAIVYATGPSNEGLPDRLVYRRTILIDQPAYGEYAVAVSYASDLAKRVFAPIKHTSFKTVGDTSILRPLDFVLVDGQEFRLMSVSRKYSADANDFITEYECEWLGG